MTFLTYFVLFLAVGSTLFFLANPKRDLQEALREATKAKLLLSALAFSALVLLWGAWAWTALLALQPPLAYLWAGVWLLSLVDWAAQWQVGQAMAQGDLEAGAWLNHGAYKAWALLHQVMLAVAALAILLPPPQAL